MLTVGPIAFAAPYFLVALLGLPLIWWLLRTTPPVPRRIRFPAVRLLFGLRETEETPARTPLWLLILRMVLATLIILGLSRPILNPDRAFDNNGPLFLVVDNGWAAASRWPERQSAMADLIARAARDNRAVAVLATAATETGAAPVPLRPVAASEASDIAQALMPRPWPVDRTAAAAAVDETEWSGAVNVIWLSDGVDVPGTIELATRLQKLGSLHVVTDTGDGLPLLLRPPATEGNHLAAEVDRPSAGHEAAFWLRATDEDGEVVTRQQGSFASGQTKTAVEIPLPIERRNRIARLAIENQHSAGATVLLDERWRRRPVGLVSGRELEKAQPLLSDLYYLERALEPFSEVRRGQIKDLLDDGLAVLVLADVGTLTAQESDMLEAWIRRGGVLIRFAGPRLSQGADDLVPVRLRRGERSLGGVMSWSKPAKLAPFDDSSPFAGLSVPDDVEVKRQILAEPSVDLVDKTWARLTDGTPLVTGDRRGDGWVVLVHTTANADWSNLPLSGLFVDLLRRLTELSEGVVDREPAESLAPIETMDGFGRLGSPPATAHPIAGARWSDAVVGASSPPGLYGSEGFRRALNLAPGIEDPVAIGKLPQGVVRDVYGATGETDALPWLLTAALILLLADLIISLSLRGLLVMRAGAVTTALVIVLMSVPPPAGAQGLDDPFSPQSMAKRGSLDIHLAYVLTGIPQVDGISRDGLRGLSAVLTRRTAVEPAAPMAVDIESDELSVYPLLYWPVVAGQDSPSDAAVSKLNDYLRNGGMILFDTGDQAPGVNNDADATRMLRNLVRGFDVPPLTPIPEDHVLTRSFYLISDFPGRWKGGSLWVEQEPRVNDGVSSVIVGGNDWAAAWAIDETGRPKFAVVPDGERQRELAFRFGVNLVMYALTGNYKADQVHVPAIMERLGL
jgi:hypothetical protein